MEILYPNIEMRVYLYFLLLCLIPVEKQEWNNVLEGLLMAGFLFSITAALLSHTLNPYFGDGIGIRTHWGGFIGNPARAGEFLDLMSGLAFISIIFAKERNGRFGLVYLGACVWFAVTIVYGFLIGKTNYFVGLLFLLMFVFVFGFKKSKPSRIILRGCLVLSLMFIFGYVFLDLIDVVASTGFDPKKLHDVIDKTPLHFFPGFANNVVRKISDFSQKKVAPELLGNPVLALIDSIASSRVVIARGIWKVTSFTHSTGQYYRYSTSHTGYIEPMYHYGYLAGGLNLLLYISAIITAIFRYLKEKEFVFFAVFAILALAFGVWTGEAETALYPMSFMALFVIAPCLMEKGKLDSSNGKE